VVAVIVTAVGHRQALVVTMMAVVASVVAAGPHHLLLQAHPQVQVGMRHIAQVAQISTLITGALS